MSLHDDLTHVLLEQQRLRELQGEAVQRGLWAERQALTGLEAPV